jgi:2-dehydro-3-deoxyphosphogluconate aldolase / (4S)-4-hydroxy-2-oxoglutarate aldolase
MIKMQTMSLQLQSLKVIPVVAIEDAAWADPMGAALAPGGLPIAEVTFRTAAAEAAIKALAGAAICWSGRGRC